MKFTIVLVFAMGLFGGHSAFAQAQGQPVTAVVTESSYFCKVEEFSAKKADPKKFKRCDAFVEANDRPVKNGQECKDHALAKGQQCIKAAAAEKISVKVKFTEKFGNNRSTNTWTCEIDNKGGSACP